MMRLHARLVRLLLALVLLVPFALAHLFYIDRVIHKSGPVMLEALPVPTRPPNWPEQLDVEAIWNLSTKREDFGSYSAVLVLPENRLRFYSDKGGMFEMPRPGINGAYRMKSVGKVAGQGLQDIESATRDPVSGAVWLGYEWYNGIRRMSANGQDEFVIPPSMKGWSRNGGPEAMTRLSDGRFIILREVGSEGLLFPADPVDGSAAVRFSFDAPEGFSPVDMAQLPDGRLLILVRGVRAWFPPFKAALLLADPATIRPGENLRWTLLASLDDAAPSENYEAIAVEPVFGKDGVRIWIASDDNYAALQRTLLLELEWTPDAKKGAAARPGAPSG